MTGVDLTRRVPCATCGGCKRVRYVNDKIIPAQQHSLVTRDTHPCPDCTDGTVRVAVSCASCRYASRYDDSRWTYRCSEIDAGEGAEDSVEVDRDFGCTMWTAKEGTDGR